MRPTIEILVDPDIPTAKFACDLGACRGACCTLPGGRGAPLDDDEVDQVRHAASVVAPALSPSHREVLELRGAVEGGPGDRHTTCVDDRACVFVIDDGGIARCSIEQAYLRGELGFRKPLSCHLFPIRYDKGDPGRLRYEVIRECDPGRENGERTGTPLTRFVRDAMERAFGGDLRSIDPSVRP